MKPKPRSTDSKNIFTGENYCKQWCGSSQADSIRLSATIFKDSIKS